MAGEYFIPGQNEDMIQDDHSEEQPYLNQPNPTINEFNNSLVGMPNQGLMQDTSGNPLQEGAFSPTDVSTINDMPNQTNQTGNDLGEGSFGHSEPAWKRDESYASARTMEASLDEFPFYTADSSLPPAQPGASQPMPGQISPTGQPTSPMGDPMATGQPVPPPDMTPAAISRPVPGGAPGPVAPDPNAVMASKTSGLFSSLGEAAAGGLGSLVPGLGETGIPEGLMAKGLGDAAGTVAFDTIKSGIGGTMNHLLGNGANQQAAAQQGSGVTDTQGLFTPVSAGLHQMARVAAFGDDYDSPAVNEKWDTDGDPEKVDPHEHNDGDNDTWQKDAIDVNGVGGTNEDTFAGFDPESPGAKMFEATLPLIQKLLNEAPGSGKNHPEILNLDKILENDMPGYKDHGDKADPKVMEMILNFRPEGEGGSASLPHLDNDQDNSDNKDKNTNEINNGQSDDLDSNDIEKESKWAQSGDLAILEHISSMANDLPQKVQEQVDFLIAHKGPRSALQFVQSQHAQSGLIQTVGSLKICAHCSHTSSMPLDMCPHCGLDQKLGNWNILSAGPENAQQMKMVLDKLVGEGGDPGAIAQAIINDPDAFQQDLLEIQGQQQIDAPGAGDSLTQAPPPPPEAGDDPGAGMPMPPPPTGQQPISSVRTALKSIICPKCGSHTNNMVDAESGGMHCSTCNHQWEENIAPDDGKSTDLNHTSSDDSMQEKHKGTNWVDSNGEPLQVGNSYLVYSPNYRVPDKVVIKDLKPNSYVYQQSGNMGIPHENEVTKEEADVEGLQFVPDLDDQDPGLGNSGIEENNDYAGQADPNQQTDLSNSQDYQTMSAVKPEFAWLFDDGDEMSHTAGKKYTLSEQRDLIMEDGKARNLDSLSLSGTHYASDWDEEENPESEFLW